MKHAAYAVTTSRTIPRSLWAIEGLANAFDGDLIYYSTLATGCYVTIGFRSVEDLNNFNDCVDRLTTPIVEVFSPWYVKIWRKIVGRVRSLL